MGRNRRRRSGGDKTRRWFLAGGALVAGGVALGSGSQALSQITADQFSFLSTSGDDDALLGLEPTSSVRPGIDDQQLVTLTNNTGEFLEATLSLSDPDQGQLSNASPSLASGATDSVTVSVASDSPTGEEALPFEVVASSDAVTISLVRAVTVTNPPVLRQQIRDHTQNSNAAFTISYQVRRLPDFERIEVEVENVDAGHIEQVTYVEQASEQTLTYPPGGGTDGGAAGNTYEFRFRVYDVAGEVEALYTERTTTADGQNPPGDELRDEDDPKLVGFTVTNDVQHTNNRFTVDYEVDQLEEFQEVQVEFDNREHDWSDETISNADAPIGTVVYPPNQSRQGGVNGDTYDVTVQVYSQNGIPVDSGTVQIEAGSNATVEWSE